MLNSPGCRKQCIFKRGVENLPYPMSMTQNRKRSVVKSSGAPWYFLSYKIIEITFGQYCKNKTL